MAALLTQGLESSQALQHAPGLAPGGAGRVGGTATHRWLPHVGDAVGRKRGQEAHHVGHGHGGEVGPLSQHGIGNLQQASRAGRRTHAARRDGMRRGRGPEGWQDA
jgi:hypothetical protein